MIGARHAIAAFLHADTIDYLQQLALSLSKKRDCKVTPSEAIEYLVAERWRKQVKKRVMKKHDAVTLKRAEMR